MVNKAEGPRKRWLLLIHLTFIISEFETAYFPKQYIDFTLD